MNTLAKRKEVEKAQDWLGEAENMPWLQFPAEWEIQIIPPFSDAVIRFKIKLPSGLIKSVFLDSRGSLVAGDYPLPYWEVLPFKKGKPGRCRKHEIEQLLGLIATEEDGE